MSNKPGLLKRCLFALFESRQKKSADQKRLEAAQLKRVRKNNKRLEEKGIDHEQLHYANELHRRYD